MNNKTALIFGITGQVGSYLTELLLRKGYKIYGVARRVSVDTTERINHLLDNPNLTLYIGDITDSFFVYDIINKLKPDECYNLAAMSHVGISFSNPINTFDVDCNGVLYILEAIRHCSPKTRFLTMSSSEMYGSNLGTLSLNDDNESMYVQDDTTEFAPNSPYAVAKLAAHHLVRVYRESYKLFSSAILCFNNESPRRGDNFVTRKITRYVAMVHLLNNLPTKYHTELDMFRERMEVSRSEFTKCGLSKLKLGNIDAFRDWGHSQDYVQGIWLSLQHHEPDDFVLATNETHSVREFLKEAFSLIGKDYKDYIVIDELFYRPCEVNYLCGSYKKAKEKLGWEPKIKFKELVKDMVESDIKLFKDKINYNEKALQEEIGRPKI